MNYVGIDLGTSNSVICSYDGEAVRLYKNPDQGDVTPSAIYIDRRGKKFIGRRAYDNAARDPDSAAVLFKPLMGTSTPVKLTAAGLTWTPEECSAEILRALVGYLPDKIKQDKVGTVVTVPAAFNQMQKDATMTAADAAEIGAIALMQEPVAAVMSVMRQRKADGVFLVFDLGGGTLDVAIAQSISGRVSLLAHDGIAKCGGRDFDRLLFDNLVRPWLSENFRLPESLGPAYTGLRRLSIWAAEKAKIELSQRDNVSIGLPETELRAKDLDGKDVYLDIPLNRITLNALIFGTVDAAIGKARETIARAGLKPEDIERVVFVGGPTQYQPLRERVSFELSVAASTEVNPMTAVAEGAAIFAESIDWKSETRGRKNSRGSVNSSAALKLSFDYIARTPMAKARVIAKLDGSPPAGVEFQIDSLDTGWSSGRVKLAANASIDLPLARPGDNSFKVFVFDVAGHGVELQADTIVVARTAASVDAIPASHTISIEALDKVGGRRSLDRLVKQGEQLPKRGRKTYKAESALKSGSPEAIRFNVWEGDIEEPIQDNRQIGTFKITGTDIEDGVIPAGADLVLDYVVTDSGNVVFDVTVPSIRGSFQSGRNFYSRQDGAIDYADAVELISHNAEAIVRRLIEMSAWSSDGSLDLMRTKVDEARAAAADGDPDRTQAAMDVILEAKKQLFAARNRYLKEIRRHELQKAVEDFFNEAVQKDARASEVTSFENLVRTAERAIDGSGKDFEHYVDELRAKTAAILWRQDWFVIAQFKWLAEASYLFPDKGVLARLIERGNTALRANEIAELRNVVFELNSIRIGTGSASDMAEIGNIIRSG